MRWLRQLLSPDSEIREQKSAIKQLRKDLRERSSDRNELEIELQASRARIEELETIQRQLEFECEKHENAFLLSERNVELQQIIIEKYIAIQKNEASSAHMAQGILERNPVSKEQANAADQPGFNSPANW